MNESIRERIIDLISALDVSKNQFAKNIGTSSAMISKITTKDINFGVDIAGKIINTYPQVNPVWLLTGVGEMYTSKKNDIKHNILSEEVSNAESLSRPKFSVEDLLSFYDLIESHKEFETVWVNGSKLFSISNRLLLFLKHINNEPIQELMVDYIESKKTNLNNNEFLIKHKPQIDTILKRKELIKNTLTDLKRMLIKIQEQDQENNLSIFISPEEYNKD